jgi:threonine synthase
MHPRGRISEVQERQMTSVVDPNVFNLAVEGTFDDCQRVLKTLFIDRAFKEECSLGAVNSINWSRILSQIVYYFYAAFRVMDATSAAGVRFTVPTGNFGDVFAGYMARRMGLPVRRLVLATNENDILARFFATGVYSLGKVHATLSPSMDIQVASNFERYLYYAVNGDADRLRSMMATFEKEGRLEVAGAARRADEDGMSAGSADRPATLAAIRETHERRGYLADPHTAVGLEVASRHVADGEPMICLATAHPAKFGKAIAEAVGKDIARHPALDGLAALPTRCDVVPAVAGPVRDYIRNHVPKSG